MINTAGALMEDPHDKQDYHPDLFPEGITASPPDEDRLDPIEIHSRNPLQNKEQKEGELTVLSIEFVGYRRFFAIYGHASGLKLRAYQDMVVSCAAEHGGKVIKMLNEGATAYYTDPDEAIKSAVRMETSLRKYNSAVPKQDQIEFAIFMHLGPGIVEGDEISGPLLRVLTKMTNMPGRQNLIHVSEHLSEAAKGMIGIEYGVVGTVTDTLGNQVSIHEVRWEDGVNLEAHESLRGGQFQHRYALIEGNNDPCFYCGSKRHPPSNCPSKHLPEITQSFDKLRYLSVKQLNALFSETISKGLDSVRLKWEQNNDVTDTYFDAYHGFYDVKRVFQLRFARVVMSYRGDDWHRATKARTESDGGPIWVALDYLRTGDIARAEPLLQTLYDQNPHTFRTNMAMGYLNIERGHYIHALDNFRNAYNDAGTKPRKIHALLLACRVHYLYFNDTEASREQIRLIAKIDRDCPEALYQDLILRMRDEKDSTAVKQFLTFIRRYPEYYLTALMDPDLISVQAAINEELRSMVTKAKENAGIGLKEAENRMKSAESWFKEDDPKIQDLRERFSKAREIYGTGSYLGYLDVTQKFSAIVANASKVENESRAAVKSLIEDLYNQVHRYSAYFGHSDPTSKLGAIQEEILNFERDLESSLPYKDAVERHRKLAQSLLTVQEMVDKMEQRRAVAAHLSGFSKKAILFFFMTALVGLLLLFAGQHEPFRGMEIFTGFLSHRGSILFGSFVISLIMAAIVESMSHSKKKGIPSKQEHTKTTRD
jgi:hypothetical protein